MNLKIFICFLLSLSLMLFVGCDKGTEDEGGKEEGSESENGESGGFDGAGTDVVNN